MEQMDKLCEQLIRIRKNENATFANQGQGMDGYSMLAHYNSIIDKMIKLKEKEKNSRSKSNLD